MKTNSEVLRMANPQRCLLNTSLRRLLSLWEVHQPENNSLLCKQSSSPFYNKNIFINITEIDLSFDILDVNDMCVLITTRRVPV